MANSLEAAALLLNETLAIQKRMIKTAAELLKETRAIRKKYEKWYKETGETYNVFKAAKIHEDEKKMCNVLATLLDPEGLHYRKEAYLNHFIEKVVTPHIKHYNEQQKKHDEQNAVLAQTSRTKAEEVKLTPGKAKVIREHQTNKGKFIDIVIKEEGKVFIPIEAKIGTRDSRGQINAYAEESGIMNPTGHFIPVLFLTKNGDPAKYAKKEDGNYICISFKEDILLWLEACLEFEKKKKALPVEDMKNVLPVREVIITQYIKAIKAFCGIMEDEAMEEDITKLITEKDDNYEAALKIYQAVNYVKGKVRQIFENQILNLVKKEFPDINWYPEWGLLWYDLPLSNGLQLSVSHDMKQFFVQKVKTKMSLSAERKDKIISKMTEITNDNNLAKKGEQIWVSNNTRYHPVLEGYDGDMYCGVHRHRFNFLNRKSS